MTIVGIEYCSFCSNCNYPRSKVFIVKGLLFKHKWCKNCLIDKDVIIK